MRSPGGAKAALVEILPCNISRQAAAPAGSSGCPFPFSLRDVWILQRSREQPAPHGPHAAPQGPSQSPTRLCRSAAKSKIPLPKVSSAGHEGASQQERTLKTPLFTPNLFRGCPHVGTAVRGDSSTWGHGCWWHRLNRAEWKPGGKQIRAGGWEQTPLQQLRGGDDRRSPGG